MDYYTQDIAQLVEQSPYLRLAKVPSATAFLRFQCEVLKAQGATLSRYPGEQVEALDFFYACLRGLGALRMGLMEPLARVHSWRGFVWTAWLATLEPSTEAFRLLASLGEQYPENAWLSDGVKAALEGKNPEPPIREYCDFAAMVSNALAPLPRPEIPLRLAPSAADLTRMHSETEVIRRAYRAHGAEAAREATRGTLAGYYAIPYPDWARLQPARPEATGTGSSTTERDSRSDAG